MGEDKAEILAKFRPYEGNISFEVENSSPEIAAEILKSALQNSSVILDCYVIDGQDGELMSSCRLIPYKKADDINAVIDMLASMMKATHIRVSGLSEQMMGKN